MNYSTSGGSWNYIWCYSKDLADESTVLPLFFIRMYPGIIFESALLYLALTVILFTELPPKSRNQRFLDIEWVRYDMNIEQGDMLKESKKRNKAERIAEEFDMV